MRTYRVGEIRFKACGPGCAECYIESLDRGGVQPSVLLGSGKVMSWPAGSLRLHFCANCQAAGVMEDEAERHEKTVY